MRDSDSEQKVVYVCQCARARARYTQQYEIDKLPKIYSVKEENRRISDERMIELVYRWPDAKYSGWNYEVYDKETKTLSGHFGHAKKVLKEVWDSSPLKELIKS